MQWCERSLSSCSTSTDTARGNHTYFSNTSYIVGAVEQRIISVDTISSLLLRIALRTEFASSTSLLIFYSKADSEGVDRAQAKAFENCLENFLNPTKKSSVQDRGLAGRDHTFDGRAFYVLQKDSSLGLGLKFRCLVLGFCVRVLFLDLSFEFKLWV